MADDHTMMVLTMVVLSVLCTAWLMQPQDLTRQQSMQYVTVDNADGVRNVDTFFPQQARCIVWPDASIRSVKMDDTFVREVVSNPSTHGVSCPEGTQYHEAERW